MMKLFLRVILFVTVTLFGWIGPSWLSESPWARGRSRQPAPPPVYTELRMDQCSDGDTCEARTAEGIQMTIRLLGMDAPETFKKARGKFKAKKGQRFADEAKQALNSKVQGKLFFAEIRGRDIYHRNLVILKTSRKASSSINQDMIREGFAFAYRDKRLAPDISAWALEAEALAKKNKTGLWALPDKERPDEPRLFRKRSK